MSQYDWIVVPALLILSILFLYYFTKWVTGFASRKARVLMPVAATILYVLALSLLNGITSHEALGEIMLIVVPTLAVLTVFPFIESAWEMKNRMTLVTLFSVSLTIGFWFYILVWNFYGFPKIFLPVWELIPATGIVSILLQVLAVYGEMLILCGAFAGALGFALSYLDEGSLSGYSDFGERAALIFILAGGSLFFNSFFPGFLAIFLYLVLRKISFRPIQIAIPVLSAICIAYVMSIMQEGQVYFALAAGPYDFTLFSMLLLALGMVTLFPVFQRYVMPDEMPSLYICSSIAVVILSFLFHDPAQNLFEILARGLSTITDSGVFAMEIPIAEGMARKLILYFSAVLLSATGYAVMAVTTSIIRKKKRGLPVPDLFPAVQPDGYPQLSK